MQLSAWASGIVDPQVLNPDLPHLGYTHDIQFHV